MQTREIWDGLFNPGLFGEFSVYSDCRSVCVELGLSQATQNIRSEKHF